MAPKKRARTDENNAEGGKVYPPSALVQPHAHVSSMDEYARMHAQSISNPSAFWDDAAKRMLDWFVPYDKVQSGSLSEGNIAWFLGGKLNVCYNCVDRHLPKLADKVAILYEGDDPSEVQRITYRELHAQVCRLANVLRSLGVRKGDVVCIYMPMIPEVVFAMLACARIGAAHSVVFAGFSAKALRDRINDAKCSVVLTANQGLRGGKVIHLKKTVDEALLDAPTVRHVVVHDRTKNDEAPFDASRDVWMHEAMAKQRPVCPCEWLDSEDVLFLLYTSGSTGSPKGVCHTQAGYLLYASMTHLYTFDYHPGDVFACVADVGWITGHSYIVYGPLANGATTFVFESVPTSPSPSRYWDMVERHKINILYTSPTAIRALMRFGNDPVTKHDRSSLRILGTVGEPINPEAWKWYFEVVGESRCAIVDTFWQTETGGHMLTPLPGCTPMKPGSATLPFFGVEPVIVDEKGNVKEGNDVEGILLIRQAWPSIARTIHGDHKRYLSTYLEPFPGFYFTGDGCKRDADGFYWITGRVDDVINVSGHRLGTAEIESALVAHSACAEAAVVAVPHDVKGQGIFAYCVLRSGYEESTKLVGELRAQVRSDIGPIATPERIVLTTSLPKTRSGKIMRRILRKLASGDVDQIGDVSTLADPSVIDHLQERIAKYK